MGVLRGFQKHTQLAMLPNLYSHILQFSYSVFSTIWSWNYTRISIISITFPWSMFLVAQLAIGILVLSRVSEKLFYVSLINTVFLSVLFTPRWSLTTRGCWLILVTRVYWAAIWLVQQRKGFPPPSPWKVRKGIVTRVGCDTESETVICTLLAIISKCVPAFRQWALLLLWCLLSNS